MMPLCCLLASSSFTLRKSSFLSDECLKSRMYSVSMIFVNHYAIWPPIPKTICIEHCRVEAVSCKVDKNMETDNLCFFGTTGGILETQELFPTAHCTHKPMYAYLPLFMSSWNMQEYWDSVGDGRICEGVSPLCVLAPRI